MLSGVDVLVRAIRSRHVIALQVGMPVPVIMAPFVLVLYMSAVTTQPKKHAL